MAKVCGKSRYSTVLHEERSVVHRPGMRPVGVKCHNTKFRLWWPGLEQEIETFVGQCEAPETIMNRPATAPLHPWLWAIAPWERIHVDFAELNKQHYIQVVEVYSRGKEVLATQQMTAEEATSQRPLCIIWPTKGVRQWSSIYISWVWAVSQPGSVTTLQPCHKWNSGASRVDIQQSPD